MMMSCLNNKKIVYFLPSNCNRIKFKYIQLKKPTASLGFQDLVGITIYSFFIHIHSNEKSDAFLNISSSTATTINVLLKGAYYVGELKRLPFR